MNEQEIAERYLKQIQDLGSEKSKLEHDVNDKTILIMKNNQAIKQLSVDNDQMQS